MPFWFTFLKICIIFNIVLLSYYGLRFFFNNDAALSLVNCHCFFVSSELRARLKNLLDRFYRSTSLSFKLFKINKSCFYDVLNWLQFQVVLFIQHKQKGRVKGILHVWVQHERHQMALCDELQMRACLHSKMDYFISNVESSFHL